MDLTEVLVGRGAELETIASQIHLAATGQGRTIVVSGAPGVGKTRLVHRALEAGRLAGDDVVVLHGGCVERPGPHRPSGATETLTDEQALNASIEPGVVQLYIEWSGYVALPTDDGTTWSDGRQRRIGQLRSGSPRRRSDPVRPAAAADGPGRRGDCRPGGRGSAVLRLVR